MLALAPSLRVILIGGTSHVGKSTVAALLAAALGWECRSTDKLARHPGRPWRNDGTALPSHVAAYYAALPVAELVADVLRHDEANVWPQVAALVRTRMADPAAPGLVLEGSALWPEFPVPAPPNRVAAVWLTATPALLAERVYAESRYTQRPPEEQLLIRQFLARTHAFGRRLEAVLSARGLLRVHVGAGDSAATVAQWCLQAIVGTSRGTGASGGEAG